MGVLRHGEGYGYEILQRLSAAEGLAITESTVYPVLARLADEKLLTVRAAPSPSGPPRRYYRLTPLGLARLREMAAYWKQICTAVNSLVKGETR
jgi:PadR family transcriptional regulator PadR